MTEKQIERSILDYLDILPECFAWKNNSIGVFDTEKNIFRRPRSRYLIRGVSDIIGIYKGHPLFIEVKSPKYKNRLTLDQKAFLETVRLHGGIAFVATSIQDVRENLDAIKSTRDTACKKNS